LGGEKKKEKGNHEGPKVLVTGCLENGTGGGRNQWERKNIV